MDFRTAAQNISDAALALGLASSAISDPYASTDQNVLLLTTLANELGKDLLRMHAWRHLQRSATISTSNGSNGYALESDFHRLVDGSMWNNTTRLPVVGPIDRITYQQLLASSITLASGQVFLLQRESLSGLAFALQLYPTPTATQTIGYAYNSLYWAGNFSAARVSAAATVIAFDSNLFIRGLKLYWKRAKGYDTSAAQLEFDESFEHAKSIEPAPSLNLAGGRAEPMLGLHNIPDHGFGS